MIHGQNHKGNTWNTANVLVNAIDCEKEVREFFLPRELNKFCLGCCKCLEGRELCPFWEEKKALHEAMIWADLIILTTPNYCMMPSAPMKAFIDLFYTYWLSHRPQEEMFSKRAVVISTAAGTGAGKAAKPRRKLPLKLGNTAGCDVWSERSRKKLGRNAGEQEVEDNKGYEKARKKAVAGKTRESRRKNALYVLYVRGFAKEKLGRFSCGKGVLGEQGLAFGHETLEEKVKIDRSVKKRNYPRNTY